MNAVHKENRIAIRWVWMTLICTLVFLILVLAIRIPGIKRLDNQLNQSLDPLRTKTLIAFFSKLTDFGDSQLLSVIIALAMLYLLFRKKFFPMILLPAAFFAERQLNETLKSWVMRDRPAFPHLVPASGYSFPSGHAMNVSTVYGLLIVLIAPLIQTKWVRKLWVVINLAMILLIGFSRPFLNVHFFSDILAGYCMGGLVVGLTSLILIFIDRRRRSR
ncbi:phosphatase PAP2 family protein [Sporolactobacillus pectinivorans]|uniref:phosphatase PAP2 family protein n=1 Tax=Sporolactobacillus pectinivorans TaxID=1591408 RepID=UPI000C25C4CF|nr:phosphatase PAP2 family protein [Sporolactobacillus pectinivorans]